MIGKNVFDDGATAESVVLDDREHIFSASVRDEKNIKNSKQLDGISRFFMATTKLHSKHCCNPDMKWKERVRAIER